jgi:predicted TPR repeat methyltransferase
MYVTLPLGVANSHWAPHNRSVYYQDEPELVLAGYHSILADATSRGRHVRAVHSLATLEGATTTRTAAPAYVAEVFDELAESFEEKLVAHLEYRVPWQLVEALQTLAPPGFVPLDSDEAPEWVVADVGCGTGLCGRLLRPHMKHIIGVRRLLRCLP